MIPGVQIFKPKPNASLKSQDPLAVANLINAQSKKWNESNLRALFDELRTAIQKDSPASTQRAPSVLNQCIGLVNVTDSINWVWSCRAKFRS